MCNVFVDYHSIWHHIVLHKASVHSVVKWQPCVHNPIWKREQPSQIFGPSQATWTSPFSLVPRDPCITVLELHPPCLIPIFSLFARSLAFWHFFRVLSLFILFFHWIIVRVRKLHYLSFINALYTYAWASLVIQMVKNLPTVQETQVRSLGQEDFPGGGTG